MANELNLALKAKYAFYSTLIFFLIASPETYKITQHFLGSFFLISTNGCPSVLGFFFHTILFFFALWGLMLFPHDA